MTILLELHGAIHDVEQMPEFPPNPGWHELEALRPEQGFLAHFGVRLKDSALGKAAVLQATLQSIRDCPHHGAQMCHSDMPGQGHARYQHVKIHNQTERNLSLPEAH